MAQTYTPDVYAVPVEIHPPELYCATEIVQGADGFEAVGEEALRSYEERGFLAIENAFSLSQVEAAKQAIQDLVDGKNPNFTNIQFEAKDRDHLNALTGERRLDAVRKLMGFVTYDDRLAAMSEEPRLLALLQRLIQATPTMFQDMALLKPPVGREKPWHQDKAYFTYPVETRVVGVWIALDEATLENGCMHVFPGAHRDGPLTHFLRRDWQICDTQTLGKSCAAIPLKPGGCLLFDGLLPHGTPHNHTSQRRRALQFHYAPENATRTDEETRLALFGSEGKNVTC